MICGLVHSFMEFTNDKITRKNRRERREGRRFKLERRRKKGL